MNVSSYEWLVDRLERGAYVVALPDLIDGEPVVHLYAQPSYSPEAAAAMVDPNTSNRAALAVGFAVGAREKLGLPGPPPTEVFGC